MKPHTIAVARVMTIIAITQLLSACVVKYAVDSFYDGVFGVLSGFGPGPAPEDDRYDKTALGRNVLCFTVDNIFYTQGGWGGYEKVAFEKDGHQYLTQPFSYAVFNTDEEGYIIAKANLGLEPFFFELYLKIPERDIEEDMSYSPVVDLYYLYLPTIYGRDENGIYGRLRRAIYRKATITEACLTVNTFYPEGDNSGGRPYRPVLSGEFSFSGYYTDSLGTVCPIIAKDGFFDLSDSPKLFDINEDDYVNYIPKPPHYWPEYDIVIIDE